MDMAACLGVLPYLAVHGEDSAESRDSTLGSCRTALELDHLHPFVLITNGPRCALLDLPASKHFGPLELRHYHYRVPNPMLEEDILCRLGDTVLPTTPSLLPFR